MANLIFPTIEELFDRLRPPRLPHPKIPKGEQSPAMEVANRECVRLLVNTYFFDPPITDDTIRDYAKRYNISFKYAELQLREIRR